ncbi:MAG: hypothetical protein P9L93_06170 [Candidatus Gorgyraea atricola]|nr:hypothetical protein [Candidatus Gorgyraea atricola]
MIKFKKLPFLKIISLCVSICFFVHTIVYAAPNLRPNSILDRVDKIDDEKRLNITLSIISSNSKIEKEIRLILESLRPVDFQIKNELTLEEFEQHIKSELKKRNIKYKDSKTQPWNTFFYLSRDIIVSIVSLNLKRLAINLPELIFMTFIPSAYGHQKFTFSRDSKLSSVQIVTTGRFNFTTPILHYSVILGALAPKFLNMNFDRPFLLFLVLSALFSMVMFSFMGAYFERQNYKFRKGIKMHELIHGQTYLSEDVLKEKGKIKKYIGIGLSDYFEKNKESLKKTISRNDFFKLEEEILAAIKHELKKNESDIDLQKRTNPRKRKIFRRAVFNIKNILGTTAKITQNI